MSKQESVSDWFYLAKAYDKAKKETVVPYVFIRIEDRTTREVMKTFDVSRKAYEKNIWFFRWKLAEFQCQRPRHDMVQTLCFYDKKTGLNLGFGSLLSKIVSANAQITIIENKIADYKELMKQDLFFDESTDPVLSKLKSKIEFQRCKKLEYENEIKAKLLTINK